MIDYFKFSESDLYVARLLFKGEDTPKELYDKIVSSYAEGIEKLVKGLYYLECGEEEKHHYTWSIVKKLCSYSSLYIELKNYRLFFTELESIYFKRRYPSKNYCELDLDEFLDIVTNSESIISILCELKNDKTFQLNIDDFNIDNEKPSNNTISDSKIW